MDQCFEHQNVKAACAAIPQLVEEVHQLICALNGEVGKPGWMTQQELRMAALERQIEVVMRVMWGLGAAVGLAVVAAILKMIGLY